MRFRRAAAAACLLPVAAGLVACGEDDTGSTRPGDVVSAREPDQFEDGERSKVMLPTGKLDIYLEEPTDTLSEDDTRELRAYDAPAGATYVPLTWQYDTSRFDQVADYLGTTAVPSVDLVTEGETYRLPPPKAEEPTDSYYVLVDGDAEDLALEVEFDGVTQTVDLAAGEVDPGRAEALYDLGNLRPSSEACGSDEWFPTENTTVSYNCGLTGPLLLPYAAGRWAKPGHEWLSVELATVLSAYSDSDGRGNGAHWGAAGVRTQLRLGKQAPVEVLPSEGTDNLCPDKESMECKYAARAIFEVTEDYPERLRIEQTYRLRIGPKWGTYNVKGKKKVVAEGWAPLPG
jgi:hypothetical protein